MNCEFNQGTGRCKNGVKMSSKCERNPQTKRCRKTARKPKKPSLNPKTPIKPQKKPKFITTGCKPGSFRNPATNRCVTKKGPIGKKIFTTNETTVIGGPISLNYFEFTFQGIKRKLLSLGDEHTRYNYTNEKTVITLPTFIKKIVRQSPHCIDLFVENAVYQRQKLASGKQLYNHSNPLNAVRREFYGCPYHNFTGNTCPYDNLRYHNWDLRFEIPLVKYGNTVLPKRGSRWKSNPYDAIVYEAYRNSKVYSQFTKIPAEKMIRYILGFRLNATDKKRIDDMFDWAFNLLSIQPDNSNADYTFQDYRKQVIQRSYAKLKKNTRFPKNFLETFIKVYKRDIAKNLTDYTTVFTDFYLLCRMFQKYQRKNRGPKECRDSDRCEYMILYAGDSHNEKINAFIKEMFGDSAHIFGTNDHKNKKINLHHPDFTDNSGNLMFQNVDELIEYFLD